MIASLRGTVIDKGLDHVVIECSGVGYQCQATARTLANLARGEEAFVLTTMIVREDSQTLYAFDTAEEKRAFAILQTVSGVGARLALGVMSVLTPENIARAVESGDVATLQKAPGVGKRVAERMAVDLKGKLCDLMEPGATGQPAVDPVEGAIGTIDSAGIVAAQVEEALVGLGFTEAKAKKAITDTLKVDESLGADSSALLRAALNRLSS